MNYEQIVYDYIKNNYNKLLREPDGIIRHKFIVPGAAYQRQVWDWDSFLTDVGISQVAVNNGTLAEFYEYQKGCVQNFADFCDPKTGRIPVVITEKFAFPGEADKGVTNASKPVLIQHALFICRLHKDYEWVRPLLPKFKRFLGYYKTNCQHESGLYYFINDSSIGVDNDPCTFFRPKCSSGSIYLNCFMFKELSAMAELCKELGEAESAKVYNKEAEDLKNAVNKHCYDERNGFYYSVDLNLLPIDPNQQMHKGCPRDWCTLIQRIDVWSGFMALWAGIASKEQAERVVLENYLNRNTFYANYGVRSLSRTEKMYAIRQSGNPSCWLGPIWGISNYMVFRGLLRYGYTQLAEELYEKTITLFGKDIAECGEMHEYYHPDTGVGVSKQGFQSWNLLCANMIQWKRTGTALQEF